MMHGWNRFIGLGLTWRELFMGRETNGLDGVKVISEEGLMYGVLRVDGKDG